jgi:hypothetical protein
MATVELRHKSQAQHLLRERADKHTAYECALHEVAQALADAEARAVKPWEDLAEFVASSPDNGCLSAGYVDETGCILERIGQPDVKAGGRTYTEAARALCVNLGLLKDGE